MTPKSRLKIGMIFHGPFPTHPRIENQALHLVGKGNEVHLFCVSYEKHKDSKKKVELYKGIRIHRYFLSRWMYKLSALAYSFPLYHYLIRPKLADFIKNSEAEVIHLHNIYLGNPILSLTQKMELPLVLDLHENVPEIMKHYPHLKSGLGKLLINPSKWKKKEEELIKKANKVIVVTQGAKNEILDRVETDAEKILILPNFTNPSFKKQTYSDELINRFKDKFNVIYVGDTGERRGLESIIKAIPKIVKEIPEFNLLIIGSSKNDNKLKAIIQNMDLNNYVSMEGWQPEKLLADYIHLSDVGICPILRNIHHDTTYANKLFQYAMLGKPILASDCPDQKDLIENEGWGLVHEANNSDDFCSQLIKLYKDPNLRQELGNNGAKAVESKYNFEASNFGNKFYT